MRGDLNITPPPNKSIRPLTNFDNANKIHLSDGPDLEIEDVQNHLLQTARSDKSGRSAGKKYQSQFVNNNSKQQKDYYMNPHFTSMEQNTSKEYVQTKKASVSPEIKLDNQQHPMIYYKNDPITMSFSNLSSNTFEEGPHASLNKKMPDMNSLHNIKQDQ